MTEVVQPLLTSYRSLQAATLTNNCNLFCEFTITVQVFVLISHYLHNIGAMRGWAGGNFFLVSNTIYTTMMTMASISTLLGLPVWLMAPFRTRFTVFILACISTTVFTSSLFATVLTFIKNGRQVSLRNIVGFYFVYI